MSDQRLFNKSRIVQPMTDWERERMAAPTERLPDESSLHDLLLAVGGLTAMCILAAVVIAFGWHL